MGLFLLGIPVAIMGAKVLHDDIKQSISKSKIAEAPFTLAEQKQQIDRDFINIIQYCDAKYEKNNNKIVTHKGYYGCAEEFLALQGYYKEAIDYFKNKFDDIANTQQKYNNKERKQRMKNFESKLYTQKCKAFRCKITHKKYMGKYQAEKEVEKVIQYLEQHGQESVYCNIIMGGTSYSHNHITVWEIQAPLSENDNTIIQYLNDVYDSLEM